MPIQAATGSPPPARLYMAKTQHNGSCSESNRRHCTLTDRALTCSYYLTPPEGQGDRDSMLLVAGDSPDPCSHCTPSIVTVTEGASCCSPGIRTMRQTMHTHPAQSGYLRSSEGLGAAAVL
ncbi:hypothetical protein GDO81_012222 [Engystomops pustulosus]|uniref:Uncharacterized protein n=1 Tax=Engystomops pustulosus TaxID=76066 RepID=A0AAV7BJZ2_ENGPU|nr:hypothetical protein GDO81_012222 [Engystomops pustulosus]